MKKITNETVLIFSLIGLYGLVLFFYYFFGNTGLYVYSAVAEILSNIEVLIMVEAFGMQQTLGNILFATTFLITDILSETTGKKTSQKAVNIGICVSIFFVLLSQSWFLYIPDKNNIFFPSIKKIFSCAPRLVVTSFFVYLITQTFDVWFYHKIWEWTTKISCDKKKYLWLRNNLSTLVSQFINVCLYTFGAFYGVYKINVLWELIFSSYVIFIFTSLLDTPIIYLARKIYFYKQNMNNC